MFTHLAPGYDAYLEQDINAMSGPAECFHVPALSPEEAQQEPPTKRPSRVRNSYENGLNWAYINTAFQELVTIMRDRPAQLPPGFRLPSISLYRSHDGLLAVVSFLSK